MAGESSKSLSRDDLMLLMESYRNTIQMHTTIVEQQKRIVESQQTMTSKQDEILLKQKLLCDRLDNTASTMERFVNKVEKVDDKVDTFQLDMTKQISGVRTRLYIAMGGTVSIILALLVLLNTSYNRLIPLLEDIKTLLIGT